MKFSYLLLLSLLTFAGSTAVYAHGGVDDEGTGPGQVVAAASNAPIVLTDTVVHNLGLTTAEAELIEMRPTLHLMARLTLAPERWAKITAPIDGRLTSLTVKLGQQVTRGQIIAKAEPLAVGSQPLDITSPIDGVVFALPFALGQGFKPEDVLFEVGDTRELLAEAVLYQSPEIFALKSGTPAKLQLDADPTKPLDAVVDRIDPALNPENKSLRLYASVPNLDGRLKLNLTGRLFIGTGEAQTVTAVPASAIVGDLGRLFVFVETTPHTYVRRDVVVGIKSDDKVEIIDGVLPGEMVVTTGNYQLQYITPPPPAPAKAPSATPAPASAAKAPQATSQSTGSTK